MILRLSFLPSASSFRALLNTSNLTQFFLCKKKYYVVFLTTMCVKIYCFNTVLICSWKTSTYILNGRFAYFKESNMLTILWQSRAKPQRAFGVIIRFLANSERVFWKDKNEYQRLNCYSSQHIIVWLIIIFILSLNQFLLNQELKLEL